MNDETRRREEEARRRAEESRRETGGPRGPDPLADYEWHELGESRRERGPRPEQYSPEAAYRDQEQDPGRTRRRGSVGDRRRGLYGSQIDGNMIRAAVAEVIGTFVLVFTGTAVATAALLERPTAGLYYDSLAVALAFGLALAAVVAAVGHVSGAHVNPAVTVGLAATGKFPWSAVPVYVGAQLVGAILGAVGTLIAYGGPARSVANVAATFPVAGVGDLRAFVVELLVTFILIRTYAERESATLKA